MAVPARSGVGTANPPPIHCKTSWVERHVGPVRDGHSVCQLLRCGRGDHKVGKLTLGPDIFREERTVGVCLAYSVSAQNLRECVDNGFSHSLSLSIEIGLRLGVCQSGAATL